MNWIKTALVLGATLAQVCAANWPQLRGPHFNGSSDESGLPATWSKTENIAWSVDLPGPSASTPVIWEDRVFLSSTDAQNKNLQVICLDRKTGKILWQHEGGVGFNRDDRSNYASPTPATDGKVVIFFFGTGDLHGYNLEGKHLWSKNIQKDYGEFAFQWTFSSSPLLHNGKVYLQVLQRNSPVHGRGRQGGESFILAFDSKSGKELWKVARPSEAVAESLEAFTTPMPFEHNGRKEILIAGGDCLTGHDPETGKELWRWGTWNPTKIGHWRLVPSPVAGAGVVLGCGPKGAPIYAIKAGGSGTLDDSAIAWNSAEDRNISTDVPTPLFYKGDFFVLNEAKRTVARVDPANGKAKWTTELPGRSKFEASPTGADGKIYVMNFRGEVSVLDAEKGEVLQTIPMAEADEDILRSTIAVAHKQIFIRTNKKLYCVGK